MDKTYRVKITSQAEEQIQEIIHYIANDLNSPDSAFHLLGILEASFVSLERFPHSPSTTRGAITIYVFCSIICPNKPPNTLSNRYTLNKKISYMVKIQPYKTYIAAG